LSAFTIAFASFTSLVFHVSWTTCVDRYWILTIGDKFLFLVVIGVSEAGSPILRVPVLRDLTIIVSCAELRVSTVLGYRQFELYTRIFRCGGKQRWS